jgi:hypothetical protein
MAVNPVALLKLKDRLEIFRSEHPRVSPFFHAIKDDGLEEGSVLELRVIKNDEREMVTNIRLTQNDIETIQMLGKLKG